MTISKMVLKVILMPAVLALPACLKGPGFFKQEAATISSGSGSGGGVGDNTASVKSDEEGILTATISSNSGSAQIVEASQSSMISSAQVTFPSGSLAIDTDVTIEEGSSIAGSVFASDLGGDDLQVASAGTPVVVQSSVPMDAASPFTLAIPVTASSGLRLTSDDSLIIVIYKVYKATEGKVVAGIIPSSDLTITNGIVSFDTSYFGVYQAAVADRPIKKKIEAQTKAPILTKFQEKKLAEIVWQQVTVSYTAASRKLLVSTSAENLSATRCAIFYDQDEKEPWEHVEKTAGKLAVEISVPSDVNGTFFATYECLDQSGRISRSSWSNGIAIKAVAMPTQTTQPTQSTPPMQTTGGDSDPSPIIAVASVTPNPGLNCPAGYIAVAEYSDDETATVPEFCVMKYEAKILDEDNGFNPTPAPSTINPTQLPDSRPSGVPWVWISRNGARVACNNLNDGSGFIYSLITNAQWQSLARQIERAEDSDNSGIFLNWQNGSRSGANALNRGHTNGTAAIAADANDGFGCVNIGSETFNNETVAANCGGVWHLNKRTNTLANGEVIWDMGGNVYEWVNDDSTFNYNFNGSWYLADDNSGDSGPLGRPKAAFGPWFDDYTSKSAAPYAGLGYGWTGYTDGAVIRGSYYDSPNGVFSAYLAQAPTHSATNIGFRCAALPGP